MVDIYKLQALTLLINIDSRNIGYATGRHKVAFCVMSLDIFEVTRLLEIMDNLQKFTYTAEYLIINFSPVAIIKQFLCVREKIR